MPLQLTTDTHPVPTPPARGIRRFLPAHPGYYEGILVQGARQFASMAMSTALAIALGGGHFVVAIIAAIPFVSRMSHIAVPTLVLRYGSWKVARASAWLERFGFLAAAITAIVRPDAWTIPLYLGGIGCAYLGQAVYDAAMSAMHSEVSVPGSFGSYISEKTRWASIAGLTLGVSGAYAVDSIEQFGVPAHLTRAIAIVVGVSIHCLLARPFAQMSDIARRRSKRPSRQMTVIPGRTMLLPRTREDWAVIQLALAWGFAYGFGARQSEAMAMRTLGISVGTITLLNAALVGAGILGAKTWGRMGDRFGGRGLMALAITAFALDPLWSLTAMYVHPIAFLPAYIIWGVFLTGWNVSQSLALVRSTGHAATRIRLMSMYNVAYGLAAGVAPLLGGTLLTWADREFSQRTAFAMLFVASMLLRLSTLPVLLRLPAVENASVRHISAVYLRLVKRQAYVRTNQVGQAFRSPRRLFARIARQSV
ncbi:MAG TPA: MFS transporter [Gemmatimonadaceae bacterium]|nr:MFS transporter [Gemmatimonadaceae bacterium]